MKRVDYYKGPTLRVNVTDKGLVIERPKRIQRERTKGWKMPPNTIYVGRDSRFGNPWLVTKTQTALKACRIYSVMIYSIFDRYDTNEPEDELSSEQVKLVDDIRTLKGKNLSCWCPLSQPCHADILLEIANK